MQPNFPHKSVFKPQHPPLWYVTNGELTVGPVRTQLLMRGVEHGRVPDDCHVRAFAGHWRALDTVREIAAMKGKPGHRAPTSEELADWSRRVEGIRDEDELCNGLAWLALLTTGAESAMLHYRERRTRTMVTRSVFGPMPKERLGHALSEHDFVLQAARLRVPVVGPPYGRVEDALAKRFAHTMGVVGACAMIPVFVGDTLTAMLEIARPGHAFRHQDLLNAERFVKRAMLTRNN
jgi:hypothetical protein